MPIVETGPPRVSPGTDFVTGCAEHERNTRTMAFHVAEAFLFTLIVVGGPWLAVTVNDAPEESELG